MNEIGFVEGLGSSKTTFISFQPQTQEERVKLFRALNTPTYKLSDYINKDLWIKDIVCEEIEIADDNGTPVKAPRMVLIDLEGNSYNCVSNGVYMAIQKLIMIFGMPTWENGIHVQVVQVSKGERRMLNLDLIE